MKFNSLKVHERMSDGLFYSCQWMNA